MIKSMVIGTDKLTLSTLKKHLNIDFIDDDDYLESLVSASLNVCENYCRNVFLERENQENLAVVNDAITLHNVTGNTVAPNKDHVEVHYILSGNAVFILVPKKNIYNANENNFYYEDKKIFINLVDSIEIDNGSSAVVKWETGDNLDESSILHARLLICGSLYENRENDILSASVNELSIGVKFMLEPYMNLQIG